MYSEVYINGVAGVLFDFMTVLSMCISRYMPNCPAHAQC